MAMTLAYSNSEKQPKTFSRSKIVDTVRTQYSFFLRQERIMMEQLEKTREYTGALRIFICISGYADEL